MAKETAKASKEKASGDKPVEEEKQASPGKSSFKRTLFVLVIGILIGFTIGLWFPGDGSRRKTRDKVEEAAKKSGEVLGEATDVSREALADAADGLADSLRK